MPRPQSPHDLLFKSAFGSVQAGAGLLARVLPERILERIDLATVKPEPGTFVDEDLAASQSDLLFSVSFDGEPACVYALLEHKSYQDDWVALQLLRYISRVHESCRADNPSSKRLPPVIPLVIHHGPAPWSAGTRLTSILHPAAAAVPELANLTPDFEFILDDLTQASDQELLSRAIGLFAQLASLFLRDARFRERFPRTFWRHRSLLAELARAPNGRRAVMLLLSYAFRVFDGDPNELTEIVHNTLPDGQELIMTIAEQLQQEARLQVLRRQLELRFGSVDKPVLKRLEDADSSELDRYLERVLTASSLDEVFAN